jgi:Pentapeptide repeats (8 copies)
MVHRAYFQYCSAKGADFSRADLSHSTFNHADLTGANLTGATLREAYCIETKLNLANLTSANCEATYFMEAQLAGANLTRTNFSLATLTNAALEGAHLEETNLEQAILVQTNFGGAYIARCRIYGTAAWGIKLENAIQNELIITPQGEAEIQVDDIEVGQFIYLLLSNQKIRKVIDTVTSRAVLILGRFSLERKEVLDALRGELRERGFVPIIFDFEKPLKRDLTETVSALAHLVRFVIADITDAKSIPQELQRIVPLLPSLPIQPLIMDSQYEYAMFKDFGGYLAMLPPFRYRNKQHLLNSLEGQVIKPAIDHLEEIERRRKAFEKTLAAHE